VADRSITSTQRAF